MSILSSCKYIDAYSSQDNDEHLTVPRFYVLRVSMELNLGVRARITDIELFLNKSQ